MQPKAHQSAMSFRSYTSRLAATGGLAPSMCTAPELHAISKARPHRFGTCDPNKKPSNEAPSSVFSARAPGGRSMLLGTADELHAEFVNGRWRTTS